MTYRFSTFTLLIFFWCNVALGNASTEYGYAQLPNEEGQLRYIYSRDNVNFDGDVGVPNEDATNDEAFCQSLSGLIFTAPQAGLSKGESWSCFGDEYTYTADSFLFFVKEPIDIKIIQSGTGKIIYYSPKQGVMAIKNNSNGMVWHLSTEHGLFGSVWRSDQLD